MDGAEGVAVGNFVGVGGEDTGEEFLIGNLLPEYVETVGFYGLALSYEGLSEATVSIESKIKEINKLPNECLDLDWIPTVKETPVFEEKEITINSGAYIESFSHNGTIQAGMVLHVVINGAKYVCDVIVDNDGQDDILIVYPRGYVDNYPFTFVFSAYNFSMQAQENGTYIISIYITEANKLPEKYLPEPVIFTLAEDMQTVTCNKSYEECLNSYNNNNLTAFIEGNMGSEFKTPINFYQFNSDGIFFSTIITLGEIRVIYYADGTISFSVYDYIDEKISAIEIPSIEGLATETFVQEQINAIEIPSTEGLATETYVNTQVANLVNTAPDKLNTLDELAAALGDDENFATTVTNQIASKVDKVDGKGLSSNDYTNDEKNKLADIEAGANKTTVDTALSTTSTNPVQNKVVTDAMVGKKTTGTIYTIDGIDITAGTGAEIFNNYTNNKATGNYSHAEGYYTKATGNYSHVEGNSTTASGENSHAEGNSTKASAFSSHAEGQSTTASGKSSHAEGSYTIATEASQHVQGKWNLPKFYKEHSYSTSSSINLSTSKFYQSNSYTFDKILGKYTLNNPIETTKPVEDISKYTYLLVDSGSNTIMYSNITNIVIDSTDSNKVTFNCTLHGIIAFSNTYAHIVGNGTAESTRSNAHTLDWSGNAWFAGEVYVGSTSGKDKDSGSVKLAKSSEVVGKKTTGNIYTIDGVSVTAGEGAEIFNNYYFNIASGNYSHAEGDYATATGTNSHAEGNSTTASGNTSHAEGYYTTASGQFSHAEGGNTIASNENSHAEGRKTIASGIASHAEGRNAIASGGYSHAESDSTTASGTSSHAEGYYTTAIGTASHAEGSNTIASGNTSHAEGNQTIVIGNYGSHAEGDSTTASGDRSHAEGYNTTATESYQHVQGKYNIYKAFDSYTTESTSKTLTIDTTTKKYYQSNDYTYNDKTGLYTLINPVETTNPIEDITNSSYTYFAVGDPTTNVIYANITNVVVDSINSNKITFNCDYHDKYVISSSTYAHIVGNGTSSTPSNAHTLDWDGNAWFSGDVYVGSTSGTNKDSGSKKLVAAPTNAVAGDLLMYNGTDWVTITKADLIAEIIAALPSAEEASF